MQLVCKIKSEAIISNNRHYATIQPLTMKPMEIKALLYQMLLMTGLEGKKLTEQYAESNQGFAFVY
jgi:hypothetical protein